MELWSQVSNMKHGILVQGSYGRYAHQPQGWLFATTDQTLNPQNVHKTLATALTDPMPGTKIGEGCGRKGIRCKNVPNLWADHHPLWQLQT